MTNEERRRAFNTKLAAWGDRTCDDIKGLVGRTMLHLPPGTAQVPEMMLAQLRVVIGFALREAALAGMQLQARMSRADDIAVLREDRPLTGVTATARRVVSDLRPAEHVVQRMAKVVEAPPLPPAAKAQEQRWDEITTEPMRGPRKPIPDLGDES